MARYQWPAAREHDDPRGRGAFNTRFAPSPTAGVGRAAPFGDGQPHPRGVVAKDAPSGATDLWSPIGPSVVLGGQATGRPRVAGRIVDLAIEPAAGRRIYAATASGGVWFSGDGGDSWTPLDEWAVSPNRSTEFPVGNALACGAIAVDFKGSAATDVVWVATGEAAASADGVPGGSMAGIGVVVATGPAAGTPWGTPEAPLLAGHGAFRMVLNPAAPGEVLVASSIGLVGRSAAGAWATVPSPLGGFAVDAAVTTAPGSLLRVWLAAYSALWVAEVTSGSVLGAALDFRPVTLTDLSGTGTGATVGDPTRIAIAVSGDGATVYVLGRRTPSADAPTRSPAALWAVPNTITLPPGAGTATGPVARLDGVPADLFGATHDQSHYDIAVAVHPDHPDVVMVAGSTEWSSGQWNAALYRCDVSGSSVTATYLGDGVHADVHVLRFGPVTAGTDRAFLVGCDGGVFRSDRNGRSGTYTATNTGLAVLEAGFVACHPTNDGIVVAGFQDNGTSERLGDSVWTERFVGDGGGCAWDPASPFRYYRQYTTATWESSDGAGVRPVKRHDLDANGSSEQIEDAAAPFYSGCAAVRHGGTTHLAFGTGRVWYSADWGDHWVTLPSGRDPRGTDNADLALDLLDPAASLPTGVPANYSDHIRTFLCCTREHHGQTAVGSGVVTVRWAPLPDAFDGTDHVLRLYALWGGGVAVFEGRKVKAGPGDWRWTRLTPPLVGTVNPLSFTIGRPADATQQGAYDNFLPQTSMPGRALVTDVAPHDPTRGVVGSFYVATTGEGGTSADVHLDTLWWFNGTDAWTPAGLRSPKPGTTFDGVLNGGHVTAPAMAAVVDPGDATTVYAGTSVGVLRGKLAETVVATVPVQTWTWDTVSKGLPEAAVHDLAVFHDPDAGIRLLRAALQARGVYELDLANRAGAPATFLRCYRTDTRRRRPTPLTGPATNGEPGTVRWDASPDVKADATGTAWPAAGPGEADLVELSDATGRSGAASRVSAGPVKVHVLVHHRWAMPAAAAGVKVTLLRRAWTAGTPTPLGNLWGKVTTAHGGGAAVAGLDNGWTLVATRSPGVDVDARTPRAVTFDVDLSAVSGTIVLLAVASSTEDGIGPSDLNIGGGPDATSVEDLVVRSRHAAARTFSVS